MTKKEQHIDAGIDDLEDWEREEILKVLQRNYDVKKTEERRIMQLSVRLQLNRSTDDEYTSIRKVIHQQSGAWMRNESKKELSDPSSALRKELLGKVRRKNATISVAGTSKEVNNNENNTSDDT